MSSSATNRHLRSFFNSTSWCKVLSEVSVNDVNKAGQVVLEHFVTRHVTSHEGHRSSGRGLIGQKAAHFKQEMTLGGQTGSVRQSGNVVPLCFLSRPFPFPRSLWRGARPREEGGRKGGERAGERRTFWGIPPPHLCGGSIHIKLLSKCWLKAICFIVSKERRTAVTRRRVWIQTLLFLRLPAVDRCSVFYCFIQCGKHWMLK